MSGPTNHLVVFARTPRLGQVKSRLAADIGAVAAWSFCWHNTGALINRLAFDPRWSCRLAVTPDRDASATFWPGGLPSMGQGRGDLGERMGRVLRGLPPGPAAIVGTDIPGILPRHIAKAFRALGRNDAVFGPAADGGYWLVGLKRSPRMAEIFDDVRWGTGHALADTLANTEGLSVALTDTLADIDDGEAYARWRRGKFPTPYAP